MIDSPVNKINHREAGFFFHFTKKWSSMEMGFYRPLPASIVCSMSTICKARLISSLYFVTVTVSVVGLSIDLPTVPAARGSLTGPF